MANPNTLNVALLQLSPCTTQQTALEKGLEFCRQAQCQGAEIILVPNACDMEENRKGQLKARAFENMTGIALANYADGEGNGNSVAYDGVAFEYDPVADKAVTRNQLLVEGEGEGILLARFDLGKIRAYRAEEVWGNAFRKVGAYSALSGVG